jgi:hypothetical protein
MAQGLSPQLSLLPWAVGSLSTCSYIMVQLSANHYHWVKHDAESCVQLLYNSVKSVCIGVVQTNTTALLGFIFAIYQVLIGWCLSNWGNGQIWFTSGDNRSFYWPNGAVTGRVFTGKIDVIPGISFDFRGLNNSLYSNDAKDNNKCVGASCPAGTNSCGPCSNGKECNDLCIKVAECCDGCPPWQVCSSGRCVCPPGVKDCSDPLPL